MRRTMLMTTVVFVFSMALCFLSESAINRVIRHAHRLRNAAVEAMEAGSLEETRAMLAALANYLEAQGVWLEMLMEHDALHEINNRILEAQLGLEYGGEDDFYQSIVQLGEELEHIGSIEEMSLSNLY